MSDTIAKFRIPEGNWSRFQDRIKKLSSKSLKLMGEPVTAEVVDTVDEVHPNNPMVFRRFFVVCVTGPTPKINGWSFVGALDRVPLEGGAVANVVRTAPNQSLPSHLRDATECEHCRTNRARKTLFVLQTTEHGATEYKTVGRACLKDFLGHPSPEGIAGYFEALHSLTLGLEEDDNVGGGGPARYGTIEFLARVCAHIRVDGWVSGAAARMRGCESTAHRAFDEMGASIGPTSPTPDDYAKAKNAVEWLMVFFDQKQESGETLSDYFHNLNVILRSPSVDFKSSGLVASSIPTAETQQGHAVKRAAFDGLKNTSEFLGQVGDKITLKCEVVSLRVLGTMFGESTLIKFIANDSLVVWFASGDVVNEWDAVGEILIRGTVKAHEVYNGCKQTVLTRVSMTSQEKLDKEAAKKARKAAKTKAV